MHTAAPSHPLKSLAIAAITGYQRYLSPHKGFSCAHRCLYGGLSCSEYVKRTIGQQDLWSTIALSRQRFQACHRANQILKQNRKACARKASQLRLIPHPHLAGRTKPFLQTQAGDELDPSLFPDAVSEPQGEDWDWELSVPGEEKEPEPPGGDRRGEYVAPPGSTDDLVDVGDDCGKSCVCVGSECCLRGCVVDDCASTSACGDPLGCCGNLEGCTCGNCGDPAEGCGGCFQGLDCSGCGSCF